MEQELELKKVLVRFISHEIRTPLNTVFMGLQYLEDEHKKGQLTTADLSEVIVDLKFSCGQSLEILNQLLTYDKIESGHMSLDKTTFPVMPFLQEAVHQFYLQVRHITIA